jgi:predicted membrane channel-forming protein YqfA (hemolysin III family)
MHQSHLAFAFFTCLLSAVFAGMVSFNYLARGRARSLREVRLVLLCWAAVLACYALSCRFPSAAETWHWTAFVVGIIGGSSGLYVNGEQQRKDHAAAQENDAATGPP